MIGLVDLGPVGAIPGVGPVLVGAISIIGIIASALGIAFGGSDTQALANQVAALQAALAAGIQQVTKFAWAIAKALGDVLQWIHDLLVGLIGAMWDLLKKIAGILRDVVNTVIPTILKIIRQMRQFLAQVYQKYIYPVLVWLQYLRQWLALLKIFHIGWATKLDGWLVKLQGYIVTPFLYVLRSVNSIGTWVNLVVTAGGLIQRAIFINTMYAYAGDWIPMWWTQQMPQGVGAPLPATPPQYAAPTVQQVSHQVAQFVQSDSGPMADYAAIALAAFNDPNNYVPPVS